MMRKKRIGVVAALFLVSLSLATVAAAMEGMQGMKGMIVLGTQTQAGVKAMAHLMNVPAAPSKTTRHFMVMFNDAKTGAPITGGLVALKVTDPSGATSAPVRLMPMTMGLVQGFGTNIGLAKKGTYRFEVGSRLPDGRKRQFRFTYVRR